MKDKWWKIRTLADHITGMTTEVKEAMKMEIPVTINGTTTTITLIDYGAILSDWRLFHGDRVYYDPYKPERTGSESAILEAVCIQFLGLWSRFKTQRADAYGRMYSALAAEALTDPTENYDRMEEGGWKDTNTIGERESNTDTTPAVINTSEQFIAGDDSATPVIASKNVVTPGGQTDNVKNTSEEATDTTEREYQDYRVHGNIGVSTAADMAEKILELRDKTYLERKVLDEFIDLYTVYYGGR